MTRDQAETIALQALGWLAGNGELAGQFLGATGTAPQDLAARAGDPYFLASVLDFLLMEDHWILAAAQALGRPPEVLGAARRALPGGEAVHWT